MVRHYSYIYSSVGKLTLTLEDVAELLSLNVLGDVNLAIYMLSTREQELVTTLKRGFIQGQFSSRYSMGTGKIVEQSHTKKASYSGFMRCFLEDRQANRFAKDGVLKRTDGPRRRYGLVGYLA